MSAIPKTMRAAQIKQKGGKFEIVELPVPTLSEGEVLIKVEAVSLCHGDCHVVEMDLMPISYPRTPGHEVAGTVVAVDSRAKRWKVGDRVAVGWHGGHCFECDNCLHGIFNLCVTHKATGVNQDGGCAEYMKSGWEALARIPDSISFEQAAPFTCAGLTVFNSLRSAKALPGSLVAVTGFGGLGHLAIQFANKCGYRVAVISTSEDKREFAKELGAHHYINAKTSNVAEELMKLGGARVILATPFDAKAQEDTLGGLGTDGVLISLGVPGEPLKVPIGQLLPKRASVLAWPSGPSIATQETLEFAALTNIKCINEECSFDKIQEAYDRMARSQARYRMVVKFNSENKK